MNELKKELLDEAKLLGLDIAEDGLKNLVKFVMKSLPKIAAVSESKIDDLVVPMIVMLEPKVLELVDQLDGKEG